MRAVLLMVFVLAALGAAGFVVHDKLSAGDYVIEIGDTQIPLPRFGGHDEPRIMKVIYLNRDGATLTAGADDSHLNQSSIVKSAEKDKVVIPKFAGTDKRWREIVDCVRKQYAAFDVEIVDQRPEKPGYVMAVFGGTPALVGASKRTGGLAPFNSEPIEDPVVLIFTRTLREQTRATCETAAMEIAHTYGLDHEYTCKDPMGYLDPCGARTFQNAEIPCGEKKARLCADGKPTQNSHGRLLGVLGARQSASR